MAEPILSAGASDELQLRSQDLVQPLLTLMERLSRATSVMIRLQLFVVALSSCLRVVEDSMLCYFLGRRDLSTSVHSLVPKITFGLHHSDSVAMLLKNFNTNKYKTNK